MWVTHSPTTGEEMKMPDIIHCFMFYPQFQDDFKILINNGIIKHVALDQYEWTKSKTSLAEYFKWIGSESTYVPGGFWAPIENTFLIDGKPIKRGSLTKLAGNNANSLKPKESKDFIEIQKLLKQHKDEVKRQEEEAGRLRLEEAKLREAFQAIKELVKNSENGGIETLRETKEKIENILVM